MASSSQPARNPAPKTGDPSGGTLLTAADVARVVDRMAHQLIERAASIDPGRRTAASPTSSWWASPRGAPLARRLAARIEAFTGARSTSARPTSPSTATTCGCAASARWSRPAARPRHRRPARRARGRRPVLRPSVRAALDASATWAARAACSSPSWSTGATASCRSAPTSSARTCPTSAQQVKVRLAEIDGVDEVLVTEGRGPDRGMKRHLLEAADLDRADATWSLDTAARDRPGAGRPRGQEAADAARPNRGQPLLRGLHPHPHLLRTGRQAAVAPTSSTSPRRAAASPRARASRTRR